MTAESLVQALSLAYLWAIGGGFLLAFVVEALVPRDPVGAEGAHARRVFRNLTLAVIARFIAGVVVGIWILRLDTRLFDPGWGPLQRLDLPLPALVVVGVVVVDFGQYVFHRLMHRLRWLWLVHAVHHSDPRMDVSTTLRFHPVENALNVFWKAGLLGLLGLPMWLVGPQTLLMIPVAILQHANVRVPSSIDRALSLVIAAPCLHRIHHSPLAAENNANFGEVFSIWDRLFGTLRETAEAKAAPYGLANLVDQAWQTLDGMLLTPLRARRLRWL